MHRGILRRRPRAVETRLRLGAVTGAAAALGEVRDVLTPLVSGGGAVLVLGGRYALEWPALTAVGAAVLVAGALVNSARCPKAKRVPVGVDAEAESRAV